MGNISERKMDNLFRSELARYMALTGLKPQDVAERLGMNVRTFYLRRNNPSSFTVGELRVLREMFPGITLL